MPPRIVYSDAGQLNIAAQMSRYDCERGGSIDSYRSTLAALMKRREQYFELRSVIDSLKLKIDAAEQKHSQTVAPLQRELDNEATPTKKRIQLRADVIAANSMLASQIAELRQQIEAADTEATLLAVRGIDPVGIETAVAESCGPGEENERLKVLRRTADILGVHSFGLKKNAQYRDADTLDPEGARLANGVADMYCRFERIIQDEITEIRQRRIAALYAEPRVTSAGQGR